MNQSISIAEMAEEHAPALLRTAALIDCLRRCTLLATTPQAARIKLQKIGNISPHFATELSSMANDGLDVLGDATKYFLNIQLAARSMGSTIERLQQSFGKPEERVTHDRLLNMLERQIGSCTEGSEELKAQLAAWRQHVKNFQIAIQRTQSQMEIEADKKEQEIGKLEDEKKKEEAQLERARVVEREAREKYEEAKKNKQSLVHEIVLPEQFNASEIVWQATKFSWSWFWTRGASQDARSAQDEAEQRQRAAEAFEVLISDAQVDLSYKNAKFGDLEKCKKGVASTLCALALLTDNVRDLVIKFQFMGPQMKQLTDKYRDAGALSKAYVNDMAPGSEIKLFTEEMHHMGQFALTVEHMAWVYGGMIERVLMGGISDVSCAVDAEGFELSLAMTALGDGGPQNDSVSSPLLTDVTTSFSKREKALQLSYSKAVKMAEKTTKAQAKKKSSIWSRR